MKVCLLCENPAAALGADVIGGIENQVPLLASHLAARGHDTTIVVPGMGGEPRSHRGVEIVTGWDPTIGRRGVRAFTYRLPQFRRTLTQLAADAYYLCGYSHLAPSLVTAAHDVGACSLLALASDADLSLRRGTRGGVRRSLYEWSQESVPASLYYRQRGLRRASCVVAQTKEQLERCRLLGLRSKMISNVVDAPPPAGNDEDPGSDVIYVGSLSRWKGIDALAELVAALGEVSFEIVGPVKDSVPPTLVDQLLQASNVRYLGRLPHAAAWDRIRRSRVLINTSPVEGFANVMLEAWAVGIPVVSLAADPNGLLSGPDPFGRCARGSVAAMVTMIRSMLADDEGRKATGRRASEYVRNVHSPSTICGQLEDLVAALQADGSCQACVE
jgi:glycosyltransferase involved in cell wall biosynthesis